VGEGEVIVRGDGDGGMGQARGLRIAGKSGQRVQQGVEMREMNVGMKRMKRQKKKKPKNKEK